MLDSILFCTYSLCRAQVHRFCFYGSLPCRNCSLRNRLYRVRSRSTGEGTRGAPSYYGAADRCGYCRENATGMRVYPFKWRLFCANINVWTFLFCQQWFASRKGPIPMISLTCGEHCAACYLSISRLPLAYVALGHVLSSFAKHCSGCGDGA